MKTLQVMFFLMAVVTSKVAMPCTSPDQKELVNYTEVPKFEVSGTSGCIVAVLEL